MSVTLLVSLGSVISVQAWKGKWDKLNLIIHSSSVQSFWWSLFFLFVIANSWQSPKCRINNIIVLHLKLF